jgi:hypothetical protein
MSCRDAGERYRGEEEEDERSDAITGGTSATCGDSRVDSLIGPNYAAGQPTRVLAREHLFLPS